MSVFPNFLLKKIYTIGSLKNQSGHITFSIKNRLANAQIKGVDLIKIDNKTIPLNQIYAEDGQDQIIEASEVSDQSRVDFPLGKSINISIRDEQLQSGKHQMQIAVNTQPFGKIHIKVEDRLNEEIQDYSNKIPRDELNDYSKEIITERLDFARRFSNDELSVIPSAVDANVFKGNCEHYIGTAQVPIGIAGPLKINGEHAQGDFLIPLATTEGSLVASYNRGMKMINACGGVKCTVVDDVMQRAPVFVFASARESRDFSLWVTKQTTPLNELAQAVSQRLTLTEILPFTSSKFSYVRFGFKTADAAGQNMVNRATFDICNWIAAEYSISNYYLESNMATDKKPSAINTLHSRGKRVTAEVLLKREVLLEQLAVTPEQIQQHFQVANLGAFMAHTNNNGLQATNALAALFIATGQDVANIAEGSSAITYAEVTDEGDFYGSITLPSLIVASYGGGTGLPTQRECLEMMNCYGEGMVNKLAEVFIGVVAAGEMSLAAAISSADWVSAHETFGKNR